MTQTAASYHWVPDALPVGGQSLERFANITFRGPRGLLVAWDT